MKKYKNLFLFFLLQLIAFNISADLSAQPTQDATQPVQESAGAAAESTDTPQKKITESATKALQEAKGRGEKAIADAKGALDKAKDAMNTVKNAYTSAQAYARELSSLMQQTAATSVEITQLTQDITSFPQDTVSIIQSKSEECMAKVNRIKQNAQTINSMGEGAVNISAAGANFQAEINRLQQDCIDEIEQYKGERARELNSLSNDMDIKKEQAEKLKAEYEQLYNKMTGKKGKDKKDKKENEAKVKKKNFLEIGQIPTIDLIKELEKVRLKEKMDSVTDSVVDSMVQNANSEGKIEEVEAITSAASTMPGKSDTSVAATEAISAQTLILKGYIEVMLSGLKARIAQNLASSQKYTLSNDRDSSIMDLANYQYPPPASMLEMTGQLAGGISSTITDVQGTIGSAVSTVDSVQNTMTDAQSTVTDTVGTGQSVVGK